MQIREHLEVIDKSVIWLWGLRGNGQEWLNLFGTECFCMHGNLIQCFPTRENQQQDDIYGNYGSVPDRGQISGFPDGEAEFARYLSP